MLPRTKKNVSGEQGINVKKRDDVVVLVNHIRGDFTRNYLAKNAILVSHAQYGSSVLRARRFGQQSRWSIVSNAIDLQA